MNKVKLSAELTDLSNKLVVATTQEAAGAAVDLSQVMQTSLAASLVSRAYIAAGIGCMITIAHATGGSVDRDALRATFEELLTTPATPIAPPAAGTPPKPITQH